jgi:hypothetical protein
MFGSNQNGVVSGCYINNFIFGIGAANLSDVSIAGNVIENISSNAVTIEDTLGAVITGNKFRECSTTTGDDVVLFKNSSASDSCRMGLVTANVLHNPTAGTYPTNFCDMLSGASSADDQPRVAYNLIPTGVTEAGPNVFGVVSPYGTPAS